MTRLPHVAAAVLGWHLARRRPDYRGTSTALLVLLAIRLARSGARALRGDVAGRLALYAEGVTPPPYVGAARVAWALDTALAVAWYVALAVTVWRGLRVPLGERGEQHHGEDDHRDPMVLDSSKGAAEHEARGSDVVGALVDHSHPRMIATLAALVALACALFALYPTVRGRPVELAMVGVFAVSLAVQLAAVTRYALRWRAPDLAAGVALVLAVSSLADAAGPWILARPVRDWLVGEPAGAVTWGVIAAVEVWALARGREG